MTLQNDPKKIFKIGVILQTNFKCNISAPVRDNPSKSLRGRPESQLYHAMRLRPDHPHVRIHAFCQLKKLQKTILLAHVKLLCFEALL